MGLIDSIVTSLMSAFWMCLALAVNDWLFKNRMVKRLDKFEKLIKKKLKEVYPKE